MKKIFRSCFTIVLTMLMLVPLFALPVSALTTNDDIVDSYIYDYYGKAAEAPLAYTHKATISYNDLDTDYMTFEPVDIFVRGDYIYIVNKGGNEVIVLDEYNNIVSRIKSLRNSPATETDPGYTIPDLDRNKYDALGQPSVDSTMAAASPYSLNAPQGVYVTEEGLIYIADTENRRIVVCDINGYVKKVFQSVKVSVLGKSYIFKPLKLVVDNSGGMQVVAYAVNRGIMELDYDGLFMTFIGAPSVSMSASDLFWRMVATEEQKKRLIKYVPTEYNNISVDYRGFLYVTISTIDAATLQSAVSSGSAPSTRPVSKLNSTGNNILRQKGNFPAIGDLEFTIETSPQIVDADSYDNGAYVILDQRTGRFFVYDNDSNLLFIGGGKGSQQGRVKTPYSIAIRDDEIIVADVGGKCLVIYEMTDYAHTVFNALEAHTAGEYNLSEGYWKDVIAYNSNMYIAYVGLGKSEMRKAQALYDDTRLEYYENALSYFEVANEKDYYSKAFKELQRAAMTENFALIAISCIALVVIIFVLYFVSKTRKRKKKKGARR